MPITPEALELLKQMSPEEQDQAFQMLSTEEQDEAIGFLQGEQEEGIVSQVGDFILKQVKGAAAMPLQLIPGGDQAIGASATARQLLSGDIGFKDISSAFEKNTKDAQVLKRQSIQDAPIAAGLSGGLAEAGLALATGGASIPLQAGLATGQAAGVVGGESLARGESPEQALEDAAWTGLMMTSLQAAPIVVAGALQTRLAKKGIEITKDGAIKLMEKFSNISKQNLPAKQAREAAEEVLKLNVSIPSKRIVSKKVKDKVGELRNRLTNIYGKAHKEAAEEAVVGLRPVEKELRAEAVAQAQVGKSKVADDLNKFADELTEREAGGVLYPPKISSNKTIKDTWEIAKNWADQAYGKNASVTKEGADIARRLVKDRLREAVEKHGGKDLVSRLRDVDRQSTNLLRINRPLSEEAAKSASSLTPDIYEAGLFAASPYIPYSGIAAGIKYAGRVGQNLGTGLAAKTLYNVPKIAESTARFSRAAGQRPSAFTPMSLFGGSPPQE